MQHESGVAVGFSSMDGKNVQRFFDVANVEF
jgi:hypothetical protein